MTRYGKLDSSRAEDRQVGSLRDPNETVRLEACQALGKRRDRSAVPALIKAAEEDDASNVRDWAQKALIDIGDPRALPTMLRLVERRRGPYRLSDAARLGRAAVSAASVDRKATLEFLLSQLQAESLWVRSEVRGALGEIGDPAAAPALVDALDVGGPMTRRATLYALIEIGDPATTDAMRRAAERLRFRRGRVMRRIDALDAPIGR